MGAAGTSGTNLVIETDLVIEIKIAHLDSVSPFKAGSELVAWTTTASDSTTFDYCKDSKTIVDDSFAFKFKKTTAGLDPSTSCPYFGEVGAACNFETNITLDFAEHCSKVFTAIFQ